MGKTSCLIAGLAILTWTAAGSAEPPPQKSSLIESVRRLEFVEMLSAILSDEPVEPGHAWFHAAQTKYNWKWLAEHMDTDHDGSVSREEFTGSKELFDALDRDRNGRLTAADFDWSDESPYWRQQGMARQLLGRGDADGDGKLSAEEWQAIFKQAAKGKDKLSADDLRVLLFPARPQSRPGTASDDPSKLTLLLGLFQSEIGSASAGAAVGKPAPDFTLRTPDDKEISLRHYRGDRPLVLVFGNFTCGPFRRQYAAMEELKQRYGDRAAFLFVYVREAHPTGGWRMESNDKEGVCFPQPQTDEERTKIAAQCQAALKMTMPVVVDRMDDQVGALYSGMPSRLYVIGRDGRIVYKSGRGPFGFKTGEMEQALILHLLDKSTDRRDGRLPLLNDKEAWKRLPKAEKGGGQPLPAWALALADALPRTTAAMLELDYRHRALSPLDARLRAKVRWTAAHANRCVYTEAVALADLERAGTLAAERAALLDGDPDAPRAEKAALAFARKLTLAADTVTDEEVKELRRLHGDDKVVALVLLLAYSNFQDRLILSLGVGADPAGPLPPLDVRFAKGPPAPPVPPRTPPEVASRLTVPTAVGDPDWKNLDFDTLHKRMAGQSGREPRIPVPAWDDVKKRMPAGYPLPDHPVRIRWSLVCMGYQPELAASWSACTRAFAEEAKQDRVFEESLFWVVTRSLQCFY
jgi:alkylhydroperoxidase family enzyme